MTASSHHSGQSPPLAEVFICLLGYGGRLPLATALSSFAADPHVSGIAVLWNDPSNEVRFLLGSLARSEPKMIVMISEANSGSAGGYSQLIEYFRDRESAEYLLLIDDDLRLEPDCIQELIDAAKASSRDAEATLFLAYRPLLPEFSLLVTKGIAIRNPSPGGCLGFSLLTVLRPTQTSNSESMGSGLFAVGSAPWGGLFIPRSALTFLGLPRKEFFLYADDSELTLRFTREGGKILLVPSARIHDADPAWNAIGGDVSNLSRRMLLLPELKVFHEVRNRSFIGRRYYPGNFVLYLLNKSIFLACAYLIGIRHWRLSRSRLIHHAVNEGERMAARAHEP